MPFRCNSSSVSMTESSGVSCHPPIRHLFFSSATLDSTLFCDDSLHVKQCGRISLQALVESDKDEQYVSKNS